MPKRLSRFRAVVIEQTTARRSKLISQWRWWLLPAILSLVFVLLFVDPFIGDWDAVDYTVGAVAGYPSSMALGRVAFIFYNHSLYLAAHALFNLLPVQAYLLFKYAVVTQVPLTVIACWTLAHDSSESKHTATIAALLVTFSPVFVVYGGQVMTEIPALLLLTLALIVHLRGIKQRQGWMVIVGAALLGAGVSVRETTAFYVPWLAIAPFVCGWRFWRREILIVTLSLLVFLILAIGGFGYWFLTDPDYRAAWFGWRESMQVEAARHPVSISNVVPWLFFFFATSPLVLLTLPLAFLGEWRERKLSSTLLLGCAGLFANLLLLLNYSTAIGWRYLLTGLPALVPLSAAYLYRSLRNRFASERAALVISMGAMVVIAVPFGLYLWPTRAAQMQVRNAAKVYDVQLSKLPRDAVLMSGAQTVAVKYWRGIGQGEWDVIGTGSGWPGPQLSTVIDNYLKQGRRVFLDADPRWWQPCGWQREEILTVVALETHFNFRRITATIYELRPAGDLTARDAPELAQLLPENRPEGMGKCLPGRR